MGAKSWVLVYAEGDAAEVLRRTPRLDPVATRDFVARLHPDCDLEEGEGTTMLEGLNPPDGVVHAHCSPGIRVLCSTEVGLDEPSRLDPRFLDEAGSGGLYLHAMHSVVDWFAFAVWHDRELVRALSLSPDSGIVEDRGGRFPFEAPFWAGARAEDLDEYPLPFHPLDLAEEGLRSLFGFVLEGAPRPEDLDPEAIALASYRVARPSRLRRWLGGLFG